MQADWEFEVGEGTPVIDALWDGFVDLRVAPERAFSLSETIHFPALAAALEKLNAPASPIWTVKCDWWPALDLAAVGLGRHELDAAEDSVAHAAGCYIDLLPRTEAAWSAQMPAEGAARTLCGAMDRVAIDCCRIDLIVRSGLHHRLRTHRCPSPRDAGPGACGIYRCGRKRFNAKIEVR
jgi:hypothetical protein